MLSDKEKDLVKSSVPLLEKHGLELTKLFYKTMLGENKPLLDIFNKRNQETSKQPTALAITVLAAAKNIDNLTVLLPYVKEIGYKHRALQVKPPQYEIVGKYLVRAIDELLHPGKEILDAWTKAYKIIADVFISVEKELYDKELWHGWVPFKVVKKEKINTKGNFVEFTVCNKDVLKDISKLNPGQYITVKVKPKNEEHFALRHYSLCQIDGLNLGEIKFAVKSLDDGTNKGLVSNYLNDSVNVDDTIELSAPSGAFCLDDKLIKQNEIPIVFIGSGSGVTSLVSMLQKQVIDNKDRKITWIETNRTEDDRGFKDIVENYLSKNKNNKNLQVITKGGKRIDSNFIKDNVTVDSDVYVCGSLKFMDDMVKYLSENGIKKIMSETYGPKMSIFKV